MDKKLKAETLALLLLFAAFPITSWGTMGDNQLVWWIAQLRRPRGRRCSAGPDALHGPLD